MNIASQWQFWIDRGGTFTDVIAKTPAGELLCKKYLSDNPEAYDDAALHGIREFLGIEHTQNIPSAIIKSVKMGTTVATNTLLEKKGDATALAITQGLEDILEVGYQARPDTFALNIKKSALLYSQVIAVHERVQATGEVLKPLDLKSAKDEFKRVYHLGFRSIAIVLMHAYKYPQHEITLAKLAKDIGFTQISTSHEVSPLAKIVSRGQTTVVDAYLTPLLRRYVDRMSAAIGDGSRGKLLFMQSSGGLTSAEYFRGRDAILSGPAGGVVGAVHTAKLAGFTKIIGFDMGGTSTDVTHYSGEFEKVYETEVAGVPMRVPMMYIHTVAAGGGSLLKFEGDRFRVGPDSAGANPGPISYRRGGELAVTDINVCLGRIQAEHFPKIFGPNQDQGLDRTAAIEAFKSIAQDINDGRSAEEVAEGFLSIAIEHMAQAIKKISISRGHDVKDYTLNCFGGAGGQHACLVAEQLGINTILLHPLSGVLSAYGMGVADIRTERQHVFEQSLTSGDFSEVQHHIALMKKKNIADLMDQGLEESLVSHRATSLVRYKGTDTTLNISIAKPLTMRRQFESLHQQRFGFIAPEKDVVLETIIVESFGGGEAYDEPVCQVMATTKPQPCSTTKMYVSGQWHKTSIYKVEDLDFGHHIVGPAIIIEDTGTIVIEKNWKGHLTKRRHLILEKMESPYKPPTLVSDYDPVTLEIFNNLFMSIAQHMGIILQNTSQSVNVKERLDFSCAIFDPQGNLVANAPHVPVHLGSMDASVKTLLKKNKKIKAGDVYVHNNPYSGGSHLPDITVITPVYDTDNSQVLFFVASRAHHEDVGGIAPGSMSPKAKSIEEEGVLFDGETLVENGLFRTEFIRKKLSAKPYPARNIEQNIADLMAQVAANAAGAEELKKLIERYSLQTVHAYMHHIQDNAELAIKHVIASLENGEFVYPLDTGDCIRVKLLVDKKRRTVSIDFTGSSEQVADNFNAPSAITRAAVLYVFRCLVDDDIPLNAGCMKPLEIIIPSGSILNPLPPAAVVAGNVETSQAITNALFAALGALGSSQGTMNNLTFGNEKYQYYETICSGSPAGPGFNGAAAVHTHMTNTRLTDPEIMEQRYPVVLKEFVIDRDSGGRGQWNAGDGVTRRIGFLENMECSILSSHRSVPLYGTAGGAPGRLGENWIVRSDGTIEHLQGCAHTQVNKGDVIAIRTPTGGGFGKEND